MKKLLKISLALFGFILLSVSCTDDLNTVPIDEDEKTAANIFEEPGAYKSYLAKLYAGLAVSGQDGPAGMPDISGIDEGFGQYLRGYWYHQEFPTDEAVIAWSDQTIKDFVWHEWGSSDVFVSAMYSRIYFQIALVNEFLRETTTAKLNERGESEELKNKVDTYRAEARFLRALSYWHALDLFGYGTSEGEGIPFVTEEDPVGSFFPESITNQELFSFIESELKEVEGKLVDARANEYGRADKAAAWTVLAKLYLNAETYINESKYTECLTYCKEIINGGYSLVDNYENLFLADNGHLKEVIFPIVYHGIETQTYGGTNFIIHAAVGGDMVPEDYGISGGWGGLRTTPQFVNHFDDPSGDTDSRAMFFTEGQTLEINDLSFFEQGYAIEKFKNITSTGEQPSSFEFVDTDFPMFRLADIYLMYAEAVKRGGSGGDMGTAVQYFNKIRERAYGDASGNISQSELTLDLILEERGRELYWECHRRTDLIRFGKLTGDDYIWSWKGHTQEGRATDAKYKLFPLPASDVTANTNLSQNPDY
ncbi:MAG: RagB/SusD family nutrient uptake outer membrane protein [Bacteroidales bacterium]|nr:RagB/SusD family nutrient uptake outer membrane protein [Bacteroidales bacterium]